MGVTSGLGKRVFEHKQGMADGFTKKYNVKDLVYYEAHNDAASAIQREKRIKEWKRRWKLELIESFNPEWRDLYEDIAI